VGEGVDENVLSRRTPRGLDGLGMDGPGGNAVNVLRVGLNDGKGIGPPVTSALGLRELCVTLRE